MPRRVTPPATMANMPKTMVMMGGPIDARKSPTAVNNLAMNKSHEWFENNEIHRVPMNYPGAGRAVYPGFLQHTVAEEQLGAHHAGIGFVAEGIDQGVEPALLWFGVVVQQQQIFAARCRRAVVAALDEAAVLVIADHANAADASQYAGSVVSRTVIDHDHFIRQSATVGMY